MPEYNCVLQRGVAVARAGRYLIEEIKEYVHEAPSNLVDLNVMCRVNGDGATATLSFQSFGDERFSALYHVCRSHGSLGIYA